MHAIKTLKMKRLWTEFDIIITLPIANFKNRSGFMNDRKMTAVMFRDNLTAIKWR